MKNLVAPALKPYLREVCVPALALEARYFAISDIRKFLEGHAITFNEKTLVGYLHELVAGESLFDAGRGWYSSLETPFILDTGAVRDLADGLRKAFPLVDFSCWSTAEIQGAMHHLLGKFVSFVMVEADAMETVWNYLREAGWDAHLNPRGKDAERFAPRERSVVVRQASGKSPSKDRVASIESLLVELHFETRFLGLMAEEDYHTMLSNLAGTRRIRMALLMSYAAERNLKPVDILGKDNQLIPPKTNRRN